MMKIVVTGATGTIGNAVCRRLLEQGHQPVALSRNPAGAAPRLPQGVQAHAWREPLTQPAPLEALDGASAVIHLLGEPISQRWTAPVKQLIRDSRVLSTRMLTQAIGQLPEDRRPAVLISQSATGYYGARGSEELDEQAAPGTDFLAGVVGDWEQEAQRAEQYCRVAVMRTGVVLSSSGGALAKMLPFFRAGIGGPVAGGRQYVPWVHIDDVASAMVHCLDDEAASGPLNLTAPRPVDNAEFSRALGHALHRPAVLPVPSSALRLLYGEMSMIVTTGQRAVPSRLTALGFRFAHPEIGPALEEVLRQP
ncbi:MAG: TIGR01777 family oxidoreductase [Solirubrobacteraceae bacterium]